jgi:hypothetical protein
VGDVLLNGRPAEGFEVAAIARGRRCDLERDLALLAGLLAEYPRAEVPVTDLGLLP